jgi:hypothetical protein
MRSEPAALALNLAEHPRLAGDGEPPDLKRYEQLLVAGR